MDPALVGIPYLSPDAIELLSNCCASKEFDLWQSLGTNWTHPIKVESFMKRFYSSNLERFSTIEYSHD